MKVVDLFCGAGGFSLGFEAAGFDVIYAIDNDPRPLETYRHNFPGTEVVKEDVRNVEEVPEADVVIGGPPCPDFSLANKKRDPKAGMELVYEFLRLKDATDPDWWIMENVPQVENHIARKDFPRYRVHNCADYGVPQKRRRCFAGEYPRPRQTRAEQPQKTLDGRELRPWVTVWEAIWDLILTPTKEEIEAMGDDELERVNEYRGRTGLKEAPDGLDEPSRTILASEASSTERNMVIPIPDHEPEGYEVPENLVGKEGYRILDGDEPSDVIRVEHKGGHLLPVPDHECFDNIGCSEGYEHAEREVEKGKPAPTINPHNRTNQHIVIPDHVGRKPPANFSDAVWGKHPPQELDEPSRAVRATFHKDQPDGYVRLPWPEMDAPSPTITAGNSQGTGGGKMHHDRIYDRPSTVVDPSGYLREEGHHESLTDSRLRRLTVRECARLQSFPDWFEFEGSKTSKYRQVGNAVPPLMAYRLAEAIRNGRHG